MPEIDVGKMRSQTPMAGAGGFRGSGMKSVMPFPNLDQKTGGVVKGTDLAFAKTVNSSYNMNGNGGPA